jgi:hypothetical protein
MLSNAYIRKLSECTQPTLLLVVVPQSRQHAKLVEEGRCLWRAAALISEGNRSYPSGRGFRSTAGVACALRAEKELEKWR